MSPDMQNMAYKSYIRKEENEMGFFFFYCASRKLIF